MAESPTAFLLEQRYHRAVDAGDRCLAAQQHGKQIHRNRGLQVIVVALKTLIGQYLDNKVQVPRFTTADPRTALSLEPHLGATLHTGNLTLGPLGPEIRTHLPG